MWKVLLQRDSLSTDLKFQSCLCILFNLFLLLTKDEFLLQWSRLVITTIHHYEDAIQQLPEYKERVKDTFVIVRMKAPCFWCQLIQSNFIYTASVRITVVLRSFSQIRSLTPKQAIVGRKKKTLNVKKWGRGVSKSRGRDSYITYTCRHIFLDFIYLKSIDWKLKE